jgi:hypothetical protein
VFRILEKDYIEEERPTNIKTYDLTEKEFQLLKHKIPDEVLERLENISSLMQSAEAQMREHPDDEERLDCWELSLQNSFNMIEEVEEHFEFYKEENPNDETNDECWGLLMSRKVVMGWLMGLLPANTINSILEGTDQHEKNKHKPKKKKKKNNNNR